MMMMMMTMMMMVMMMRAGRASRGRLMNERSLAPSPNGLG